MDDREVIIEAIRRSTKETRRLEFKQTLDVSAPTNKAEFIRDILSLSNSEGEAPREPGYLVIGVKDGVVHGIGSTAYDGATFRQLIRSYIAPELPVVYSEFKCRRRTVGVLRLEPAEMALYVVAKDLPDGAGRKLLCAGQSWGRKGDEKYRLLGAEFTSRMSAIARSTAEMYVAPLHRRIGELEQILAQSGPVADVRRIGYAVELDFNWDSLSGTLSGLTPYLRDYRPLVVWEVLRICTDVAGRISPTTPLSAVRQVVALFYECLPYGTFIAKVHPSETPLSEAEQRVVLEVARATSSIALDGCNRLKNPDILDSAFGVLHICLTFCHVNGLRQLKSSVDALCAELEKGCDHSSAPRIQEFAKQVAAIRRWESLSLKEQERRTKLRDERLEKEIAKEMQNERV